MAELTERQQRELEYHTQRAQEHRGILSAPILWDVLEHPDRRWWNAYWRMYAYLLACNLEGARVLVIGCGFGYDALRIAKLGARVSAFDLSPESIDIAQALAAREGLAIDFQVMPAESMKYSDSVFDCIVARDILHHVDIPPTMKEITRVAKPGARLVVDEMYSHSWTEKIRRSRFVVGFVYPKMQKFVYGGEKPYITEDERKLTEHDLAFIEQDLDAPDLFRCFNFVSTRLVPDRIDLVAKLDQLILRAIGRGGLLLAGRVLFGAKIRKPA